MDSTDCLAWGPNSCANGKKAIALGRRAFATTGEIALKLDGIPTPIKLRLSPECHAEFHGKIAELMRREAQRLLTQATEEEHE